MELVGARLRPRQLGLSLLFVFLFWPLASLHADKPRFSMELSPKEVKVGEQVTVTVTIERMGLSGADRYWPPRFEGLRVLDSQVRRGTSSRIDPKRGQEILTTERYRYLLEALDVGRYEIAPAKIRVGAEEWETPSRWVRVRVARPGDAIATGGSLGDVDAESLGAPGYLQPELGADTEHLLHAVADRNRLWLGQQVTVSWLLFTGKEPLSLERSAPQLEGWWQETLAESSPRLSYHELRVDGRDFLVSRIAKMAFFPTREGQLRIAPMTVSMEMADTGVGAPIELESEALRVEVKALPEPRPDDFEEGFVDVDEIEAVLDRDYLQASDLVLLQLRIKGRGALARVSAPALRFDDFAVERVREGSYLAQPDGDQWRCSKSFEYWLRPTAGGELRIDPIVVSSFDTRTEKYRSLSTGALQLQVVGQPEQQETSSDEALDELLSSMSLLRETGQLRHGQGQSWLGRWWYWFGLTAPALAYGLSILIAGSRRQRGDDHPRRRMKEARRAGMEHQRLARLHLKGMRAGKFYAELTERLYVFVEAIAGSGVRSMTRAELGESLAAEGLPGPIVSRVLDALESFETARFAPSNAESGSMERAFERCSALVRELERHGSKGEGKRAATKEEP